MPTRSRAPVETDPSFKPFWDKCPADFVTDIHALDGLIRKNAPKLMPAIQGGMLAYGEFRYRYDTGREGTSARISVACRRSGISLYINSVDNKGYVTERFAERFPKAKVGKSCVAFKRLVHLDPRALTELIKLAGRTRGAGEVA